MGSLIDTSVLVAAERGRLDFGAWLRVHPDEVVAVSAITASELLHGVHRAPAGRRRDKRKAFVDWILAGLPVRPFDLAVARVHAGMWAKLASRGEIIGPHDLLIAATAAAAGDRLVTLNEREFARIEGLRVERPQDKPESAEGGSQADA